ncbi:conserved hypothetical protein [Mesorhizobium plurifarium]|uniref:Nucleotidyl transferase AbiEii/AbiGii toxin family protein n=1 Tax=Mesorhizobium plurifarium TaxID=69974 RepID=A0A090G3H3_MESPL|nr:conserved hypothetical protein [Mesorhizobium plurifarium]
MAELTPGEPQTANDYPSRTTEAVKSVLLEIGQVLGSFKGKFAVVGGGVPWLLLDNEDMPHVGTVDVDLALDAEALGDGEYVTLVDALKDAGYEQRKDTHRRFQLVRSVPARDGGPAIDIVVDFLMPKGADIEKNIPPLLSEFAVIRADGAELALRYPQMTAITGNMIGGGKNKVEIAVASIPALLVMKGHALGKRDKRKDAYDIYYCIFNYADGIEALAEACKPLLEYKEAVQGYNFIKEKFSELEMLGPTYVRKFVEDSDLLAGRTSDQWQRDAYGQVSAWVKALGI